jgi:hypothetical protein
LTKIIKKIKKQKRIKKKTILGKKTKKTCKTKKREKKQKKYGESYSTLPLPFRVLLNFRFLHEIYLVL